MTAIDRTAYPRPGERLTREELDTRYSLSESDHAFIRITVRSDAGRLTLAALLKARQDLGCFPAPLDIHCDTVAHLASQLGLTAVPSILTETNRRTTLHHYRAAVRGYLNTSIYAEAGEQLVTATVLEAAMTMSDPADLINRAIEALSKAAIDLPAFSTLERLANHLRTQVHTRMYDQVAVRLKAADAATLDALLIVQPGAVTTAFNRLKQTPGPARPETIRLWTDRLGWLTSLVDPDPMLEGIAHTKLRQFAAEAAAMEVSDLLDMSRPGKRHTLLLSLLQQTRSNCRDELIEMLLRRIRKTQAAAKEKLKTLQDQHRGMEEALIAVFGRVLETAKDGETDAQTGHQIRTLLAEQGGIDTLAERCQTVSAWHSNNDLPLLWPIHANTRNLLFRLLDLMDIRSATQDRSLLDALVIVVRHRRTRRDDLTEQLNLNFASQRWQSFVVKRRTAPVVLSRRALEVCVFVHLADALQTGDIYVAGAENFGDYRTQLLPWAACKPRLASYCVALGMPQTGKAFVTQLKEQLTAIAAEVDAGFPANSELTIDTEGVPHLKKQPAGTQPAGTQPAGTQPAGTQPAGTQPARTPAPRTPPRRNPPRRLGRFRDGSPRSHAGTAPARHYQIRRMLDPLHSPLRATLRHRRQTCQARTALYSHSVRLRLQSRTQPNRPTCPWHRCRRDAAADQRSAYRHTKTRSRNDRSDQRLCTLYLAKALGRRPGGNCRWHPCSATREQSHRPPAHSLWRIWRYRLPPHRRQLHRPVHQLHPMRGLGGDPHLGRVDKEPLHDPAGHAPRRHAGPERAGLRTVPAARHQADAAYAQLG